MRAGTEPGPNLAKFDGIDGSWGTPVTRFGAVAQGNDLPMRLQFGPVAVI